MNKSNKNGQRESNRNELKAMIKQYERLQAKDKNGELASLKQDERMFQLLNSIAMCYAREGYINKAEKWLTKAETLTNENHKNTIIFHSNMACIFKQKNDLDTAIKHLTIAENMLNQIYTSCNSSKKIERMLIDCWLNMSALLSSQKCHEQALDIIRKAENTISKNIEGGSEKFINQLVVARYNEAIEYEHLGKIDTSYHKLQQLRRYMYDSRIYGHFLEKKINDTYQDLRKKVYQQSRHKKKNSLASSISKIKLSVMQEGVKEHSRKMSLYHVDERQNRFGVKENSFKPMLAPVTLELSDKTHPMTLRIRSNSRSTLSELVNM